MSTYYLSGEPRKGYLNSPVCPKHISEVVQADAVCLLWLCPTHDDHPGFEYIDFLSLRMPVPILSSCMIQRRNFGRFSSRSLSYRSLRLLLAINEMSLCRRHMLQLFVIVSSLLFQFKFSIDYFILFLKKGF